MSTNAPLRDEKGTLYEGGIRVPMIVRWPGIVESDSTSDTPVTSVDIYPTFLDLAGADSPTGHALDGESLLLVLSQSGDLQRDAIYWHYPHYHHSTPAGVIREGDWKLIEFYEDNRIGLYNLYDDIGETNDTAKREPDRADTMRQKLHAWRKSVNAEMPTPNPDYNPTRALEWGKHPART